MPSIAAISMIMLGMTIGASSTADAAPMRPHATIAPIVSHASQKENQSWRRERV
ncbi:hypothetical protein ACCT08_15180 [Rhizobium johnstonii]|uniref:hypothetical protein n=1 Tax=Rhizobium johnstonii TaxID=3019933 RepID=UPI003F9C627E